MYDHSNQTIILFCLYSCEYNKTVFKNQLLTYHIYYITTAFMILKLHTRSDESVQWVGKNLGWAISQISSMQQSESGIRQNTGNCADCTIVADTATNSWISHYFQPEDVSDGK